MKVGIYCRLSEEDRDKSHPEFDSESIQNQKSMLMSHAIAQGWEIIDIYSDEDYTGADRNRPEFIRLIQDAKKGRFDIVLCKAQSRFSRELEIIEKYIHGLFIDWNIRFIGLVDNADTAVKGNKKSRQINGLVNEWYLEDLSDNIRAVLDDKRIKGKFIGAFAPYGYNKSPEDKNILVIDEPAAIIVRRIFSLRSEGFGYTKIASILNKDGIPCPTTYKAQNGYKVMTKSHSMMKPLWTTCMIVRILRNKVYIGNMVQGKQKKPSYKSKTRKHVQSDKWIEVASTHEAIIDRDIWDIVQETRQRKAIPTSAGTINPFSGKLFCNECGWALHVNHSHGKHYYRCRQRTVDKSRCSGSAIPMMLLEKYVLHELNVLAQQYFDETLLMSDVSAHNSFEAQLLILAEEKRILENKVDELANASYMLFMDRVKGVIYESSYISLNKKLADELESVKKRIAALEREIKMLQDRSLQVTSKIETIKQYKHFHTLTRDLVLQFIDKIEIARRDHDAKSIRVDIHWNI